ncbi:MAG: CocE/NonD family hydrolase [Acidobacteria bacterium]|nr:CocE/NonD family hydrolase [Acidobacteriota bacterium]
MILRLLSLYFWSLAGVAEPVIMLHVKVPMRDGVRLCANIFRPAASTRYPAVLNRTPYGKVTELTPGLKAFVDRGYAVVTQDVRGRHDSEGVFDQFAQELRDGEDTLTWITHQNWSDGRIGMFGGSYVGIAQWRAALSGHAALKAIAPAVAGGDDYLDRFYSPGGAFKLGHRLRWISENYKPPDAKIPEFQRLVTYLPLRGADRLAAGRRLDFYQKAMDHPAYDAHWRVMSTRARLESVKTPALIESGWYDNFAESDLEMWSAMRALGRAARIIIGPWGHNLSPAMPEADFGTQASQPLRRMEIEWFDAHLRQSAPAPEPLVRYFVQGVNEWRESAVWPPEGSALVPFYLTSGKGANSLNGDGELVAREPRRGGKDHFDYDPRKAVPTVGGAVCCNARVLPWGPLDQRKVEGRKDVLVYTSGELKSDIEIAGAVRAVLWVSSSAPDTDFTAKLVDVQPDGRAKLLCDGILRLRYREGLDHAAHYRPGAVERIVVPAGVTSNVFRTGHRIRIEISSSNFPKYDRNLNTGRAQADEKEMRPAAQNVYHGTGTPSRVDLPVVR